MASAINAAMNRSSWASASALTPAAWATSSTIVNAEKTSATLNRRLWRARTADHEPVADTVYCFDEIVLAAGSQGTAQDVDVRSQRIAVRKLLAPELGFELPATDDAIRRLHQDAQQIQALRRQAERAVGARDAERRQVEANVGAT